MTQSEQRLPPPPAAAFLLTRTRAMADSDPKKESNSSFLDIDIFFIIIEREISLTTCLAHSALPLLYNWSRKKGRQNRYHLSWFNISGYLPGGASQYRHQSLTWDKIRPYLDRASLYGILHV